jgi:hypothetical protein
MTVLPARRWLSGLVVVLAAGGAGALTAGVLADLGYKNVKVYDSSGLGYSSGLTAPAEDGFWTVFGSLLPAMKGLENRFGELERQAGAKQARQSRRGAGGLGTARRSRSTASAPSR